MMLALAVSIFMAQDLPRGFGHPTGHRPDLFDGCCHDRDCEFVEDQAIVPTTGGYAIHYRSGKDGKIVQGTVTEAHRIKPTEHPLGLQAVCSANGTFIICIFIRQSA